MRPRIFLSLCVFTTLVQGTTLRELFESLKASPAVTKDHIQVQIADKTTQLLHASLYPKLYAFASVEHYDAPANIGPVTPTESASLMLTGDALPFSQNLEKLGVKGTMPLYNASLYALIDEMKMIHKSLQSQKRLDILSREAELVDANGALRYYEELSKSLDSQNKSIEKTKERIDVGVHNGRYAEAETLKLQNAISTLHIALEDTKAKRITYIQQIKKLANIEISQSVPMSIKDVSLSTKELAALEPLKQTLEAKAFAVKASERILFPTVSAEATLLRGWGESYNTHSSFHKDYGVVGVYVNMPIFDSSTYKSIEKNRLLALETQNEVEQKRIDLEAEIQILKGEEISLNNSLISADERIKSSEKLLQIATIAVRNERLSVEEYLRYENALLESRATKVSLEWKLWRTRSSLAIIYGIDLADILE